MTALPNPFLNPSVIRPRTERSAVASKPPPAADATAAPFDSSDDGVEVRHAKTGNMPGLVPGEEISSSATSFERATVRGAATQPCAGVTPGSSEAIPASTGGPQEASAPAPTKNPDADALGTEFIHEIFFYARKLMKQPPRFILDQARFLAEIEEVPLFIREDGYLKRQA